MAEAAALASIAKSALQLFTSLAKHEFFLLWHSQRDLKRLQATIETITYIHRDTQERSSNEDAVQHCLSRMRNVMYDAEDFFDTLAAQILNKRTMSGNPFTKEVRMFFSDANQLGLIYKTAHAVKAIRESVDGIRKDMEIYGVIRQQPHVVQPFVRPKTHSFVHEDDVIGRDEDRDRIISMLLPQNIGETSETRCPSVIAIIGFGGLGKTTLAKYVYNHEIVKQGFDVQLWACVNYLSNLEQVLIEIIASKQGRQPDLGLEKLQEKLREIISGRKFLLVLDDVWDENSRNWLKLEGILRCGKIGSQVLTTTRSRKVVECLDASKPNRCIDLAVLSNESAWSLFVKHAFYNKEELDEDLELEPLGKKIVHRCGNVPLAIAVVGSLLHHKEKSGKIWSNFLENDLTRTIVNSSGDENGESIKSVLMVSYNDLLPNLKLCFAYCSLFPKDFEFDKDVLVRLWIAQGFVKPFASNEQSLEKEGEEYFFHLAERCFFQEVIKNNYLSRSSGANERYGHTAKMHDLIHDVATDVAKIESAFIDKAYVANKGERDINLRHISISGELDNSFDYWSLVYDPNTVRTLIMFPGERFSKEHLVMSLERFRMLRALHLVWLRIDSISESLGELIHLRYLDLSHNSKLKHLPNSICKLHRLMILVLVGCELLEDLPLKIEKLVSLRQLYIHGCRSMGPSPSGLRALTSLVKLDRLIVHHRMGGLRYLQDLDNLQGSLRIELPLPGEGWLDAIEDARKANMSKKTKLSGMIIGWKNADHDDYLWWLKEHIDHQNLSKDEAKAVLDALEPHKNLEYLEISNYVGEMLSSWVGTLKYVTELHLIGCCQVEYLEDEIRGDLYFPSLKLIELDTLPNLRGWWQQVVAPIRRPRLPKVSTVLICYCRKLKGPMPLFEFEEVEQLTLKGVDIELVTELLMENINPNGSPPTNSLSTLRQNNNLKTLKLFSVDSLMVLPEGWLRHLTHLQQLSIQNDNLKWVSVSCRGLAHLTALKELRLRNGEIADIGDDEKKKTSEAGMPWKALNLLETLSIPVRDEHLMQGLHYLTSLKILEIGNWKEEMEVGDEEMEDSRLESSFKALSNLHKLQIGFDYRTVRLPKLIQYLPSLQDLCIQSCTELYLGWKSLLSMKLVRLEISGVKKVIDVEDKAVEVEHQSQLRDLSIVVAAGSAGEWLADVPWISLSSSLHSLNLIQTRGMEQLPDGIQHLISLQRLSILVNCLYYSEVKSLPIWIPKLTSLEVLIIHNCSAELEGRCEKERGEDWPLISHIPYTEIMANRYQNQGEAVNELTDENEGGGSRKTEGWGCGLSLSPNSTFNSFSFSIHFSPPAYNDIMILHIYMKTTNSRL